MSFALMKAIREVALFRTVGGVIGDTDDEVLWRVSLHE